MPADPRAAEPATASSAEPAALAARHRSLGAVAAGTDTFTQARVERILALVVAAGCAVLGTQAFVNAMASRHEDPRWQTVLVAIVFTSLAAMVLALAAGRFARPAAVTFAVLFPLALLVWPVVTAGREAYADGHPWVWYLLNVATVAAVMVFPLAVQIVWAVLVPVLYGTAMLVQALPGHDPLVTARDVVFAMILGGVIITLAWVLRAVGIGVDQARRDAVASYAEAAAAAAIEQERAAVAALMHDSVLAALIAAERADTERAADLAMSMAREALTRLANTDQDAGEGSDEPVAAEAIVHGLESAARSIGLAPPVTATMDAGTEPIPGRVARALVLAALQALANAVQHAGGRGLQVGLVADSDGVHIRVADTGDGFDPAAVGDDRLGIRGSIVARVAAVGGRTSIRSDRTGTVVHLSWERPR